MRRFIAIGIIALASVGCAKKKTAAPPHSPSVKVTTASKQSVPIFLEGLGHIDSITSIQILSRIEGELVGIHFEQGQEVKQGDLLFTIDPKPYEAALKAAQGTLNQSLANLALDEEKLKRYKILTKDEYYSQIDYETLQATYAADLGVVEQNKGQVDQAKVNLDYCWIYAPIDGLTGILNIDYGNLVSADGQNALVTLNQMDPIFITFSIPEFQLPKIQRARQKQSAPLVVKAAYEQFGDEVFEGKLFMIDNTVDPNTGMIKLRGVFENPNRMLWPGQFIRARLVLEIADNATIIPFAAIQQTGKGPVAFVIGQMGQAEERSLTLGERINDNVIVLKGINPGEVVVTEGQINLYNGAKVSIKG